MSACINPIWQSVMIKRCFMQENALAWDLIIYKCVFDKDVKLKIKGGNMALVKFNRDVLPTFSNLIDDFFGRDMLNFPGWNYASPRVNVREDENNYHVEVAAPGMKKDDFNLSLDNNVLTISSELKEENENKNGSYTRREFSHQTFSRSFTLPETVNVDKIDAKYKDGILNIVLPKKEEAKQKPAKTIKIS